MNLRRWPGLFLVPVLVVGCGGSGAHLIGSQGGTVVSADGKMELVIPAGALSTPTQITLTATAPGASPDPELVAGSTYQLSSPTVTLAVPAHLRYALGDFPSPSPAIRPFLSSPGTLYGSCPATAPVCYVEVGTGTCPADHPKFRMMESRCDFGTCPASAQWVLDCVLPDEPAPNLALLDPLRLLGGTLDGGGGLTVDVNMLSLATLGVVQDKNAIAMAADHNPIHPGDTVHFTTTQTSGHGQIGHVDYYDDGHCALDINSKFTDCASTFILVGSSSAPPYDLAVTESGLVPGLHNFVAVAKYATASGADAHGNYAGADLVQLYITPAVSASPTPSPAAFDLYVDPVHGSDSNPGTQPSPFLTLTHMATVAHSGQTIGLLDGSFYEGTTPGTCDGRAVSVPGGLTIQSVNPRAATLANISFGSSGSLTVIDVSIDGGTNGSCTGIISSSATPGVTLAMSGVAFGNGGHLVLSGSVQATLAPGTLSGGYVSNQIGGLFAQLTGSASLTISGGVLDGGPTTQQCGNSPFSLSGTSTVVLDGVTVQNYPGVVATVSGSTMLLKNSTLLNHDTYAAGCGSVLLVGGGSTVTIDNSAIENCTNGNAIEMSGSSPLTVNLTGATLSSNFRGFFQNTAFGDSAPTVTITNSSITGSAHEAWLTSSGLVLTLTVRGSQITGNVAGLDITAGSGSVLDLGTAASAGGNTINNTGVGFNLHSALTASVAGNTWLAGEGADAMGHYATGTINGPVSTGVNYQIATGATLNF